MFQLTDFSFGLSNYFRNFENEFFYPMDLQFFYKTDFAIKTTNIWGLIF